MEMLRGSVGLVLILGLILALGCGESEGEPTVAVTGTVTQKGSPLEGAIVSFVPTSAEGVNAVGVTDAAGKYSLTTRKKDDGAIPGSYKVSITKYDGPKAATSTSNVQVTGEDLSPPGYTGAAPDAPPAKNLLPAKYANADSSGLTATVAGGEAKPHDFDLEG